MYVLGTRNVHARVLGEEAGGFEEDTDVLHGHTVQTSQQRTFASANQTLTPASLLGVECVSCLQGALTGNEFFSTD